MTSERTCGWIDGIARRLIRHAAGRISGSLAERLEEEWLADRTTQNGALFRLLFALGCWRAARVIAREQPMTTVVTMASAVRHSGVAITPMEETPFFSGRTSTFVLIASVHLALLCGFAMGLDPQFSKTLVHSLGTPTTSRQYPDPRT